jgi:hypothetical protein
VLTREFEPFDAILSALDEFTWKNLTGTRFVSVVTEKHEISETFGRN